MFIEYYQKAVQKAGAFEDAVLLAIRLVLAYNFFEPAMNKLGNIDATAEFFSSIGIAMPHLNAYLAGGTELLAVIVLPAGLAVRFIGFPLIFVMITAVITLHWGHWSAGENGMEIPVYYSLFFLMLITRGAGKYSLDYLLFEKKIK